mmetsp:Transcript_46602/g.146005  ORF Transcript_46602/g.146005 Transcript_46602/m.146005 type:complete len:240 (-) Transcript_46602:809-1528(-)
MGFQRRLGRVLRVPPAVPGVGHLFQGLAKHLGAFCAGEHVQGGTRGNRGGLPLRLLSGSMAPWQPYELGVTPCGCNHAPRTSRSRTAAGPTWSTTSCLRTTPCSSAWTSATSPCAPPGLPGSMSTTPATLPRSHSRVRAQASGPPRFTSTASCATVPAGSTTGDGQTSSSPPHTSRAGSCRRPWASTRTPKRRGRRSWPRESALCCTGAGGKVLTTFSFLGPLLGCYLAGVSSLRRPWS